MSEQPIKSLGLSQALHAYLVDHGTPPDEILCRARGRDPRTDRPALDHADPAGGGRAADLPRPPDRRAAGDRARDVHGLLRALHRPGSRRRGRAPLLRRRAGSGRTSGVPSGSAPASRSKIDLRLAPALETLASLPADRSFDLAFIDAVKTEYWSYLEKLLGLLRPGGLVVVDNVLWSGSVIDEAEQGARYPGDPRLQRPGRTGRALRPRDARGGGRPDAAARALGRVRTGANARQGASAASTASKSAGGATSARTSSTTSRFAWSIGRGARAIASTRFARRTRDPRRPDARNAPSTRGSGAGSPSRAATSTRVAPAKARTGVTCMRQRRPEGSDLDARRVMARHRQRQLDRHARDRSARPRWRDSASRRDDR